jgi:hypothetical protein
MQGVGNLANLLKFKPGFAESAARSEKGEQLWRKM